MSLVQETTSPALRSRTLTEDRPRRSSYESKAPEPTPEESSDQMNVDENSQSQDSASPYPPEDVDEIEQASRPATPESATGENEDDDERLQKSQGRNDAPSPSADEDNDDDVARDDTADNQVNDGSVDGNTDLDSVVAQAKKEAQKARKLTEESQLALYEIKLKEIALEEELILSGKHPEYVTHLSEIEQKKDVRLKQSANRLRYGIQNCEAEFDAGVKLAQDSFDYAKRVLKWQLTTRNTGNRFQLQAEFAIATRTTSETAPIPVMSATPVAVFKKRRIDADDAIPPPSNEFDFENIEERPTWARSIVRKRKRVGYLRTWIPPMCSGLDQNEIDEDMNFMRLVTNEKNLVVQ